MIIVSIFWHRHLVTYCLPSKEMRTCVTNNAPMYSELLHIPWEYYWVGVKLMLNIFCPSQKVK